MSAELVAGSIEARLRAVERVLELDAGGGCPTLAEVEAVVERLLRAVRQGELDHDERIDARRYLFEAVRRLDAAWTERAR